MSANNALTTASKKTTQKTEKATGNLVGNKTAEKFTKGSSKSVHVDPKDLSNHQRCLKKFT